MWNLPNVFALGSFPPGLHFPPSLRCCSWRSMRLRLTAFSRLIPISKVVTKKWFFPALKLETIMINWGVLNNRLQFFVHLSIHTLCHMALQFLSQRQHVCSLTLTLDLTIWHILAFWQKRCKLGLNKGLCSRACPLAFCHCDQNSPFWVAGLSILGSRM